MSWRNGTKGEALSMSFGTILSLLIAANGIPAETEAKRHHRGDATLDYATLARTYFSTWNRHDVVGLRELLDDDATLRDWDMEKFGAHAVAKANSNIFQSVHKIAIDVQALHVSDSTSTVACEILVRLNNAAGDVLKVVDVITFDGGTGKIR